MAEDGVNSDNFLNDDGSIAWGALMGTVVGSWYLAGSEGAADVIDAILGEVTNQLEAVTRFEKALIDSLFGSLSSSHAAAWSETAGSFNELGPLAMLVLGAQIGALIWVASKSREAVYG